MGVTYRPLQEDPQSVEMGVVWMGENDTPIVRGFVTVARSAGGSSSTTSPDG